MRTKVISKSIAPKRVRFLKRKVRIRGKISGTNVRPRMSFFRSNKNISVQVVDDQSHKTLAMVSTYEKKFLNDKPNVETAKKLGTELANRMKGKNIAEAVFDRNGYKFHGVLQAFVDVIRESGIKI